jgi:hypothetical protein
MFATPIANPRGATRSTARLTFPTTVSARLDLHRAWTIGVLLVALVSWAAAANAQALPPSTQFDITGFLQEAKLDGAGSGALQGGHLKVNGHVVTVPANTVVILPANALTWAELFTQAPAPYGPAATGMAMADLPAPLTTYEVHVVGNRVPGAAGGDQYIAGLIDIAQNGLNSGAGYINFIDYTIGEMRVGGLIGDSTTGTRVRINDPSGRYGRVNSPDPRFTVDADNPTVMSGTGYPMCFPRTRVDQGVDDQLCPQANRPVDLTGNFAMAFTTNNFSVPFDPVLQPVAPTANFPNSNYQAPLEVGDYVTFAGMLVADCATCAGGGSTAGPWPVGGVAATFVSAHSVINNTAIFTFPGSNPAYVETDVFLMGTGGLTVLGAGEASIRTRFEGMTTDVSRGVHLYGIDLDPRAGATTDRDWGTIGIDQGPPNGAVKGRWRFRPPCLAFGTVPTKPDKQCVYGPDGTFLPPTREMRAVVEGQQSQNPANPAAVKYANGLYAGQYHAPILEYIFPENIPGSPIVENNFNAMPFLACGGYTSSGGTLAGVLNPWPSNVAPSVCAGAVTAPSGVSASASPSSPISGTGATVTLTAVAGGTTPLTFVWTQAATDAVQVVLTGANTSSATFVTPVVAANTTLNFTVSVSNSAGSASASVAVPVLVDQPAVNPIASQTVTSGTPVSVTATGTDPGGLPLTFRWTQTSGAPTVLNPNPFTGATVSFTVTLPVGTTTNTVLTFSVIATNSAGQSSTPRSVSVTITPPGDVVTIAAGTTEYRIGKQRLIINANSNIVSPNIVLTLQPYITNGGTLFDPASLGATFTNNGAGAYTIQIVGAPAPICNSINGPLVTPCSQRPLTVKSSLGGVSAPAGLDRIRQ